MPKRIQRKRTKGWKMPEGSVYVGRPTKWGNPFLVVEDRTNAEAAHAYEQWLTCSWITANIVEKKNAILDSLEELRGKDLVCWCRLDAACHADVLLELANRRRF